jgi:RNA polymerase sigma factor (sigma-70 family)
MKVRAGQSERRLGWPVQETETALAERDRVRAFEQAALPHLSAAYRLARWLTKDAHDAEDVIQEAYLRAFRYFESFSGSDARTWLLTIVRNTFHTYREKHSSRASEEEVDLADLAVDGAETLLGARREPSPDAPLLQAAESARIDAAIRSLQVEFREVLVLRELEGLSYKEIAAVAKIPIGTVMSRLARGREDLRRILGRSNVDRPHADPNADKGSR